MGEKALYEPKNEMQWLRALAQAATPGAWADNVGRIESRDEHGVVNGGWIIAGAAGPDAVANARYIAAANPAAILALLDRLEAAERDAARYRWLRDRAEDDAAEGLTMFSRGMWDDVIDAAQTTEAQHG